MTGALGIFSADSCAPASNSSAFLMSQSFSFAGHKGSCTYRKCGAWCQSHRRVQSRNQAAKQSIHGSEEVQKGSLWSSTTGDLKMPLVWRSYWNSRAELLERSLWHCGNLVPEEEQRNSHDVKLSLAEATHSPSGSTREWLHIANSNACFGCRSTAFLQGYLPLQGEQFCCLSPWQNESQVKDTGWTRVIGILRDERSFF